MKPTQYQWRQFWHIATLLVATFLLWSAPGCGGSSDIPNDPHNPNEGDELESGNIYLKEFELSAQLTAEGLLVTVPIRQLKSKGLDITMEASLADLEGNTLASREIKARITEKLQTLDLVLTGLPSDFESKNKATYLVRIKVDSNDGMVRSARSLHMMYRYVQVQLLGSPSVHEGGSSYYKLLVHEPNGMLPVERAQATLFITDEDREPLRVGNALTDSFGMADVRLDAPAGLIGERELLVRIELPSGDQQEQLLAPLTISREAKVLLTTDKPLYQPGQTIHLRALALKHPNLTPQAGLPVLFTIIDPNGNKVFKEETETSDFGIVATTFKLATLLNEGIYTLQAQVGEDMTEKTVRVERYALPKFNVGFTTDRAFYRPAQKVKATVQADYFFGKPVSGGSVTITASKIDVEMTAFATVNGVLDANGTFNFEVDLPRYFVGGVLDEDKARAFFEIAVTDTAGHTQIKSTSLLVVEEAILIALVPESGSLVPHVPNDFYLVSTDPFGRPLPSSCALAFPSQEISAETGPWGLTTVEFTPTDSSLRVDVTCETREGGSVKKSFSFSALTSREYVMVRTDKSVYKVGETIEAALFATNDGWDAAHLPDRVYLDVIKNGQTMLMTTISLKDGKGNAFIDLDASLGGALELMAYYLGAAGEIIRDRRVIFVEMASSLSLEIRPSKDTFKPAEEAVIHFSVKDADNNGILSAIGVQVVDEAVFALQEMQPGMEKIFFQLEEELLTPRYQIQGFSATDILDPMPEDPDKAAEREARTSAFLAGVGSDASYGIHINSFAGVESAAIEIAVNHVKTDLDTLVAHVRWMLDSGFLSGEDGIQSWIAQRNSSDRNPLYDPWGKPYILQYRDSYLHLESMGLDEKPGTRYDIKLEAYLRVQSTDRDDWGDQVDGDSPPEWGNDDMDGGFPGAEPDSPTADDESNKGEDGDSAEEGSGPRVRSYFPETLYVNPEIITDPDGTAQISVTMADSITSWRMTALANSLAGQIGSQVGNIIVFQDFFVDIAFPATLTQNDEVAVPIAIYNYLNEPQTIELTAEAGDWLSFMEGRTRQISVGPQSVTGIYFPIKVHRVGRHTFQVTAIGSKESDAIRRTVEVVPDGLEVRDAVSGRLDANKQITVNFPAEAIEDASKLWVKIYPGLFSQVVEGLDSMLQMPSGCFEQTSSTTYPNILVLDYMILTGQIQPEIELRARDYISQGYQRLLSYEVRGGGFEWFGNPPAHRALTAYGLLEFYDMSKVHHVDPAVITRTQDWLAGLQNSDGSWDFDAGGIHEGATNNFTNSVLRTTTYIGYALAESGYAGTNLNRAVQWVKQHISEAKDNYTLAMTAMFLAVAAPRDPALTTVLNTLYEARTTTEDGKIYWEQAMQTEMYGTGNSAALETTALAGQAFIRAQQRLDSVGAITDWLLSQKGSFGEWSTTQGTIQALRFFIATLGSQVEESDATIAVSANGQSAGVVTVTPANSDVLQLVDLTHLIRTGENSVSLEILGEGNIMYSVVSSYWLPRENNPYEQNGPLTISVTYDKTQLEVDDIVTATVTITNVTDATARMVLVDIGMPPGFDLVPDMLREAVADRTLQRYELAGRQLILYIERIDPGDYIIQYQMQARFPMNGSSGPATVANYYEPESGSTQGPVSFLVTESR